MVNGVVDLNTGDLLSAFDRLVTNIELLIGCGWQPSSEGTCPVKWSCTNHNTVADYLCNYAMDHGTFWSSSADMELLQDFKLLIHSDGVQLVGSLKQF